MKKTLLLSVLVLFIGLLSLSAQKRLRRPKMKPIVTAATRGEHLITKEVQTIAAPKVINFTELANYEKEHPVKHPKRRIEQGEDLEEHLRWMGREPDAEAVHNVIETADANSHSHEINSPAPIGHWTGVTDNGTLIPPDIRGAAGPTYVMETTNQEFKIYNKTGTLISTLSITTFFNGSGVNGFFDPHIMYDPFYGRFIVCMDGNVSNGDGGIGVAVSQTSDPTGAWYVYGFTGNTNSANLLDYPLMGYNKNWVVVTANDFNAAGTAVTGKIYVMNRATLYAGTLGTVTTFSDNNAFCWAPAQTQDTTQLVEYMIQEINGNSGAAGYNQVGSITGTANAPVYNAGTQFSITQTWSENPPGANQSGTNGTTSQTIEDDDTRVGNVVYIKNSLWFCQTAFLPANNPTHDAVQWFQINPSTLAVQQFGRVEDASAVIFYFYPSIAVNSSGDILLGHCTSSASIFPSADYSFHAGTDAVSTMQTPYTYKAGVAHYYKTFGGGRNRWGDYTGAAVDPVDNSFWGFSQWANTGNNWATEIVHVPSATCTAPVATFTNTVDSVCGTSLTVTFTNTSTNASTYNWTFGDGGTSTTASPSHTYNGVGTYTVKLVSSSAACGVDSITKTAYVKLKAPDTASINTFSNPLCNTGSTGSITVTASGGSGAYSYTWSNAQTTATANNLAGGTYTVTVRDAGGCSATATKTLTAPTAIAPGATITNVSCNGGTNGAVNLSPTGGTGAYTYNWGAGITSQNRTNLGASTYTVTVTDANNCTASASASVTQPAILSATASGTNISCNGLANGSINLTVGGGTTTYTYNWGGGITSQNRTNLGAGTYTVTVTDAHSCTATSSATISQPAVLSASATPTNITCGGANNGSINLTVNGGTTAYSYNWGSGITTQNRTNLNTGTYTVTVTDANNCTATTSANITSPSAVAPVTTPTNVSCNGGNNGAITLTVSGGTGSYTYNWGGGITSQNRTNLTAGTYTVTVTDGNTCTATTSATITQPAVLTATTTATNISCNGLSNGYINLTVGGGTTTYTYNWGSGVTSQNRTNLAAGTYTVTVTDAHSCTATSSAAITQPAVLSASAAGTNISCGGGSNGSIALTVNGGITAYSYNWGSGITTQNRTNLGAGTYTVTVTDANNCTSTASATITSPSAVAPVTTPTNVSCNGGNNGAIALTVSGGTGTYTYNWGSGVTSQNRTNLTAGTYTVTVTDGNTCTGTASVTITQPAVLTATTTATNISCNGLSNGSINLTGGGGTTTYTYNWGSGISTQNRTNLGTGTYTVTVTDANNCSATASATLTQPAVLSGSTAATNVSCNSGNNGSITLTVNGGTSSYSYNWGSGITSQNRTNLSAGTYTVTITDANTCTATASATITQPTALSGTAVGTNISCNGGNNGSITLTPNGGTAGYTYNWGSGVTSQNRTNLGVGTYNVTITDANNCTATASASITQNNALNPGTTSTNVSCNGGSNGTINLTVSGGSGTYTYNWGSGITSQNRTNLGAGTYIVTITDANNCTATASVTVTQPAVLSASANATNISCNGGNNGAITLTVNGGTTAYSYNWGSGITSQNRTNLAAGTYNVTVTDANSCTTTTSATLTEPTALSGSAIATNVSCNGGNNGGITLTVNGGTTAYTYNWGSGITTQNRTNLNAGTYAVTVTDANSCTATASATVTEPPILTITTTGGTASCNLANGSASASASGGTSAYSYNWSNGATTAAISNVVAGTYTVTATDANSCSTTAQAIVASTSGLSASTSATPTNCFGSVDGSAFVIIGTGTAPFAYVWSSGSSSDTTSGLAAGSYSVTVSDATGCSLVLSQTISQPTAVTVTATATDASCGFSNGSATATASGGSGTYTYAWTGGASTSQISNIIPGTYSVTVNDANNCSATAQATVNNTGGLSATTSSISVDCFGNLTGSASVNVITGTLPYVYAWSNGGSNSTISNVGAGTYTVTITDATLCSATLSQQVSQPQQLSVILTPINAICSPNNGKVFADVSGGTTAYNYSWSSGGNTDSIINLGIGTYSLTVIDANNCSISASASVDTSSSLMATITANGPSCNGTIDANATVIVNSGTGPYTYAWSTGANTNSISNISAGTYAVTVSDIGGCSVSITQTITDPAVLILNPLATNTSCGLHNASVSANASGGTPAYNYVWDIGNITDSVELLIAGTYNVTVTDAHGCSTTASATVGGSLALSASISPATLNCFGDANASVTVTVNNGTGTLIYLWSNSGTTATISNLSAGTYSVTITDANSCSVTSSQTITQPSAINLTATSSGTTCGLQNGTALATASGGTGNLSYVWTGGSTNTSLNGLAPGTYFITASDANSCSSTASVNIINSAPLNTSDSVTNVSCYAGTDGGVSVNVTSGLAPYQYLWSNSNTTSAIINLSASTYYVTATDSSGCQKIDTLVVSQPFNPITIIINAANLPCEGLNNGSASINVNGGSPGYIYNWSTGSSGSSISNLGPGNYNVTVQDAHNCSATSAFTITEPTAISLSTDSTGANVGQSNGSASVSASGGNPPYTYLWSNGGTNDSIANVPSGTYTVTITDANGCTATVSVNVVKIVTGIAEVDKSINFSLYPNPTSAQVKVTIDNNIQNMELQLMDVLGQTIVKQPIESQQTILDVSHYADGVYFIEIRQGAKKSVQRLVLNK